MLLLRSHTDPFYNLTLQTGSTGDVFVFNDTATTEIYTLSLHDALPIFANGGKRSGELLRSNLPPLSFSGDLILISSSLITTVTPNCSKISIKTSSPCGRVPMLPLIFTSSPLSTAAANSNARLEKSIGTVNVALL